MNETKASDRLPTDLPVEQIFSDPKWNCRGRLSGPETHPLMQDIKSRGLDIPIQVQPFSNPSKPDYKFKVISGHRRFEACTKLGWQTIPSVIFVGLTDLEARIMNLKENIERKELNILQEAHAIEPFIQAGWPDKQIADVFKVTAGWVSPRKALLFLEPEIQACAATGLLTQIQIKDIAALPSQEARYQAVKDLKDARLRGEKAERVRPVKVKVNPLKMQKREPSEINKMNSWIYDLIGPNLITRGLAWCAGEISDLDLLASVKEQCKEHGVDFVRPPGYDFAILPE